MGNTVATALLAAGIVLVSCDTGANQRRGVAVAARTECAKIAKLAVDMRTAVLDATALADSASVDAEPLARWNVYGARMNWHQARFLAEAWDCPPEIVPDSLLPTGEPPVPPH